MVEKDTPKEISETVSPTPEVKPARTIPNGGLQAWLQVVGAFFLYFNTWGECPQLGGELETFTTNGMYTDSTNATRPSL